MFQHQFLLAQNVVSLNAYTQLRLWINLLKLMMEQTIRSWILINLWKAIRVSPSRWVFSFNFAIFRPGTQ